VTFANLRAGSRGHANWQPPYEVAVGLAVAHDVTDDLDPRETVDQQA
jgi:hypothetical protein